MEAHFIKFKVGLGRGTNNFAEIMAVKLALSLAIEKAACEVQVYGDSQVVIKWMTGKFTCRNFILQPILAEIQTLKSSFQMISFHHIFRERNIQVDGLLKDGLQMDLGRWHIHEDQEGQIPEWFHASFY